MQTKPSEALAIEADHLSEVKWQPLAKQARWQFYLSAVVSYFVITIPFVTMISMALWMGFGLSFSVVFGGWTLIMILDLLQTIWMPTLRFDRWRWAIRDGDLLLKRGVFIRQETAIPLSRVQHVDVRSGPIEQWFGLATVRIHTASGLRGDGAIPGLAVADAEKLRDELVLLGGDDGV